MFKKLVIFAQGRHTLFAGVELILGTFLAWFHRLDMSYVALCTAIQGLVLAHSLKEDYFNIKNGGDKDGSDGSRP